MSPQQAAAARLAAGFAPGKTTIPALGAVHRRSSAQASRRGTSVRAHALATLHLTALQSSSASSQAGRTRKESLNAAKRSRIARALEKRKMKRSPGSLFRRSSLSICQVPVPSRATRLTQSSKWPCISLLLPLCLNPRKHAPVRTFEELIPGPPASYGPFATQLWPADNRSTCSDMSARIEG